MTFFARLSIATIAWLSTHVPFNVIAPIADTLRPTELAHNADSKRDVKNTCNRNCYWNTTPLARAKVYSVFLHCPTTSLV